MTRRIRILVLAAAGVLTLTLGSAFTVVDVTEYGVLTRFGRVVRVIADPGLHLKLPYPVEAVTRLDRRLLSFRPPSLEYLSQDKKNLVIHTLVMWRIADPVRYLSTVGDRQGAEERLADVVLARVGAVIGSHSSEALISAGPRRSEFDRVIGQVVAEADAAARTAFGIDLVDVRLRQLNLPEQNRANVFARMQAERAKIATRYRSEGERESRKIVAEAEREKTELMADAYREAARTRAEGDAQATGIYGDAFGRNPQFYKFWRTLQAYERILASNTTMFLPTDAEIFRLLNSSGPRRGRQ